MKNFRNKAFEEKKDLQLHAPSVTEYMTTKLITFREDTPITEVIDTLLKKI
ncbi:MAG: hypothetical protein HKN67_03330 [Saprospiraceae bacterium]|nr:hypothetical protein [Saprospiraceae bacterium]